VLVGTGPQAEAMQKKADDLDVSDKVIFAGLQSSNVVAAMMKQADFFVQSSYRFDNQPMVILEAIATGLPVVYCDNHLKEGLTSENALLTSGRSGRAFAKAFDELLGDDDRMKAMSRASRQVAKEFDVLRLAQKMVDLYETAPIVIK
jgi:1,2-diacylglycerol 3-alpha-glucosyltransferase